MAEKKKGFDLAAALGAVSNLDTGAVEGREQIEYIDIGRIHPDERNFYELPGIEELAANIEFAGLMDPLRVRPGDDGDYILVSGHRRHAAITLLVKEGKERFRQVACIVDKPSGQTTEVETMLQELRLIYGNSDTRRMSSADLSRQAERVEMLLYQLKEAGVEFPGKMRDHVAEACKVSASKLARLKVIRETLTGEMKEQWEAGKINESEAYELAKLPTEHRNIVWAHKGAHSWNYGGAQSVTAFGKRLKVVDDASCPSDCPGLCEETCDNLENRRRHSLTASIYGTSFCEKCCSGCPQLATCKDACPHLADDIAAAKQAWKEERAAEKKAQEERDRPAVERKAELWRRFGAARQISGISLDDLRQEVDRWYPGETHEDFEALEWGVKLPKAEENTPFGPMLGLSDINLLTDMADALGVSLDYLLCLTDDPRQITEVKKEVREWRGRGETPPVRKPIIVYYPTNDGPCYTPAVWDGSRFHVPGKPGKELTGLAQRLMKWTLLPEDE